MIESSAAVASRQTDGFTRLARYDMCCMGKVGSGWGGGSAFAAWLAMLPCRCCRRVKRPDDLASPALMGGVGHQ